MSYPDCKFAVLAFLALYLDFAAGDVKNLLYQSEDKSVAFLGVAGVSLVELFEDVLFCLFAHTAA